MYPILVKNYLKIIPALGIGLYITSLIPLLSNTRNHMIHDKGIRADHLLVGYERMYKSSDEKNALINDMALNYQPWNYHKIKKTG